MSSRSADIEWSFEYKSKSIKRKWTRWANQNKTAAENSFKEICLGPPKMTDTTRNINRYKQLESDLKEGTANRKKLPRYQYESGSSSRLWLLVDFEERNIILEDVHPGHPSKTDK